MHDGFHNIQWVVWLQLLHFDCFTSEFQCSPYLYLVREWCTFLKKCSGFLPPCLLLPALIPGHSGSHHCINCTTWSGTAQFQAILVLDQFPDLLYQIDLDRHGWSSRTLNSFESSLMVPDFIWWLYLPYNFYVYARLSALQIFPCFFGDYILLRDAAPIVEFVRL